MALLNGYVFSLLLILIARNIVLGTETDFELEPGDIQTSLTFKLIIPCKLKSDLVAAPVSCRWVQNSREIALSSNYKIKDADAGDCSLTIGTFYIKDLGEWLCIVESNGQKSYSSRGRISALLREPLKPTLKVNNFKELSKDSYLAFDPATQSDITVKCTSKEAYPIFPEEGGNVTFYVDGEITEVKAEITNIPTKPGFNSMTAEIKIKVTKNTKLTCKVDHKTLEEPLEINLILNTKDTKFKLTKSAVAIILPIDSGIVDMPENIRTTVGNRDIKWQSNVNETGWKDKKCTSGGARECEVETLPEYGVYFVKVIVSQSRYFNVEFESEAAAVMTYEPMTEVRITSDLNVNLKAGEEKAITCEADGNPEPEFYWVKVGSNDIHIHSTGPVLKVGKSKDDAGYYKCDAVQKIFNQEVAFSSYKAVKVQFEN